jgi:hypothetical protein
MSRGRVIRAIGAFCCRIIERFLFPQVAHYVEASPTRSVVMRLSVISVFDELARTLFDGWIAADRFPDATERAAVLAAVKDAARR